MLNLFMSHSNKKNAILLVCVVARSILAYQQCRIVFECNSADCSLEQIVWHDRLVGISVNLHNHMTRYVF